MRDAKADAWEMGFDDEARLVILGEKRQAVFGITDLDLAYQCGREDFHEGYPNPFD